MGTSGSYSGSGGKAGKDLRHEAAIYISSPTSTQANRLAARVLALFTSGDQIQAEREGMHRGGGAQRSSLGFARTAGRAAAASYAYRTGNRPLLAMLNLNYDELRALGDDLEVAQRIVEAACGHLSDGVIGQADQRFIAADIADWVMQETLADEQLKPDDIVRKAIAVIIFETVSSEAGQMLRSSANPLLPESFDRDMKEAAETLADKADFSSVGGVTEADFTRAIENGIKTLRYIYGFEK